MFKDDALLIIGVVNRIAVKLDFKVFIFGRNLDGVEFFTHQIRDFLLRHGRKRVVEPDHPTDKRACDDDKRRRHAGKHRNDRRAARFLLSHLLLLLSTASVPDRVGILALIVRARRAQIFVFKRDGRIALKFVDITQHLRRALITLFHILLHGVHGDLLEALGDRGVQLAREHRLRLDLFERHGNGRVRFKRDTSRQHFIKHHADRIKVCARVDRVAGRLFGRDIMHRADRLIGNRVRLAAGKAGNSKIRDFDRPVRQQHDVLRLDIAVHDPLIVRVLERPQDLYGEMQGVLPFQNAFLFDVFLERDAVDIFHHNRLHLI